MDAKVYVLKSWVYRGNNAVCELEMVGIFSTREKAEAEKFRLDSTSSLDSKITEWILDELTWGGFRIDDGSI